MRNKLTMSLVVAAWLVVPAWGQTATNKASGTAAPTKAIAGQAGAAEGKVAVVVLDFEGGNADVESNQNFCDRIRMGMRRLAGDELEILDKFSTREGSGPIGPGVKRDVALDLLTETYDATVLVFGSLEVDKKGVRKDAVYKWAVKVRVVDIRDGSPLDEWTENYTDDTERGATVIASQIVEKVTGRTKWIPPQHGDVPEPKEYGKAVNPNSDFSQGVKGWIPVDNASTFVEKDPGGRGNVLRMRNDFHRQDWLDYRRALMFKQASPTRPPKLRHDESMGGLAGLEGCDIVSDYFAPHTGWRYWMVVEGKGPCATKVFIKGWKKTETALDGMPETSLMERGLTPEKFAAMTAAQRKALIEADSKKYPTRYLREAWRWQLSCGGVGEWTRWAETFPPRGGLMEVDYLHVKILTYWPPGQNYFNHVHIYEDPDMTKPLDEEKARTPLKVQPGQVQKQVGEQ